MFRFALEMWIQRRVDDEWVRKITELGRITKEQMDIILSTPQMEM